MTNHIIPVAQVFALYQSESRFPIKFDDAWQWIGYSRKDNAKRALLSCGFEVGIDLLIDEGLGTLDDPNPEEYITLTVDCFKMWAMMAATEKGRQTRLYFLECERTLLKQTNQITQSQPKSLFDLSESQIGRLSAFQILTEKGITPNPRLLHDIDPLFLQLTSGAVLYAWQLKLAEVAEDTKLESDALRQVGWLKSDRKTIALEQKAIDTTKRHIAENERESFWVEEKAEVDLFELKQAALAENRSLALQGA